MDKDPELTLDAFHRLLLIEADKFKELYLEGMRKKEDLYPKLLRETDWWKRFLSYENGLQPGHQVVK